MIKAIILTFAATIGAVVLAASLFLNTILGVFGLAATTIDTLQNLKTSQQVVERMKKRHDKKKIKTTKRFAKRSSKRVATTALAAATIGTVAVAVTMTGIGVMDFCEEKQELQEDSNVLYGTQDKFNFERCVEEGKEDTKAIFTELKDSSVEAVSTAFNSTAQYSSEKWAAIKEASLQAVQATNEGAAGLWDAAKSWLLD